MADNNEAIQEAEKVGEELNENIEATDAEAKAQEEKAEKEKEELLAQSDKTRDALSTLRERRAQMSAEIAGLKAELASLKKAREEKEREFGHR